MKNNFLLTLDQSDATIPQDNTKAKKKARGGKKAITQKRKK